MRSRRKRTNKKIYKQDKRCLAWQHDDVRGTTRNSLKTFCLRSISGMPREGVRWGHCPGAWGHRGPDRPDHVNFFTILLSVRRYAMTVGSSQSQRNLKLQSTAEAR